MSSSGGSGGGGGGGSGGGGSSSTTTTTSASGPPAAAAVNANVNPVPVPPTPNRGGLKQVGHELAPWTGGPPTGSTRARTGPASGLCFRNPNSVKDLVRIEEACSKALKEADRLGLPNSTKSTTTLVQWVHDVRTHLTFHGMDSVFFALKNGATEYTDLLSEWNKFDTKAAQDYYDNTPWDEYDKDNIRYSGQFLRDSISVDLWRRIKAPFEGTIHGPLIWVAIMQVHQTAGASLVRMLTQQIEGLDLRTTPGEDVVALANQIYELANRIEGMGSVPEDLPVVVSKCFLRSSNLTFNIAAAGWHEKANKKVTTDWREILEELKCVYESLNQTRQWDATIPKGTDAVTALKAEISAL